MNVRMVDHSGATLGEVNGASESEVWKAILIYAGEQWELAAGHADAASLKAYLEAREYALHAMPLNAIMATWP